MLRARITSLSLVALSCGCRPAPPVESAYQPSADDPATTTDGTEPDTDGASASDRQTRMQAHFGSISEMKDAVIAGDVEAVHRFAAELTESPVLLDAPESWRPHVDAVRSATERASSASDLPGAAAAVAGLAGACGSCHRALGIAPSVPFPPLAGGGGDVKQAMAAHQWAADRMWEGVILPSDEVWIRGASTFVALPGCGEVPSDRPATESSEQCQQVQRIIRRGHTGDDPAVRVTAYGELLATCAGCHTGKAP